MKTINEVAENYFKTLNPIAERICTDILTIKEAYEDLWNSLSENERNQIINETVVHPEALLKYALGADSTDGKLDIPIHTKVTGSKYVVDENTGVVWRDEHSAPFSWKTPSQINLSIFSTEDESNKENSGFVRTGQTKGNVEAICSEQTDKNFNLKLQNSGWTQSKEKEKSEPEKNSLSPESNVVMVGTCSKLSGLCSKLKFLPNRSYSYEVQTVISNPASSGADSSILNKIKSTAVLKFQNTLKLIGSKTAEKKVADTKEKDNLIEQKSAPTIVKVTKASPKVSKPTSPPPPPPVFNRSDKIEEKDDNGHAENLILIQTTNSQLKEDASSEKATLLENNSRKSFSLEDSDLNSQTKQEDDELLPLSMGTSSTIPKSGFDFLDNW